MLPSHKTKVQTNLKKARGQIERVLAMVDEGDYCMDIAQQINSAVGLLRKANTQVLENHLLTCGITKLGSRSRDTREKFASELIKICDVTTR